MGSGCSGVRVDERLDRFPLLDDVQYQPPATGQLPPRLALEQDLSLLQVRDRSVDSRLARVESVEQLVGRHRFRGEDADDVDPN
ncbi:hypothetical protein [Haloarcula salinisoli]|uniref:Uncharacterized protein n=1 Tax=Haloarcula salinisoli TaxID=2487746 RepID=A0A8J7YRD1_9EURY|nr:hypothetical protein [Halomicroarcula salinisoli]MBX0305933.1 hypothetical protein [Halomicroarcula salinisoli]